MNRGTFNSEMFLLPQNYEEDLFVDRKQDLYGLHTRDNRKKADFVRDVIAMANTARHFGQPTYILLGIDDKGHIVGLNEELANYGDNVEHVNTWENVRQIMGNILKEYIDPAPIWQLKHGIIEGKHVAYILIEPTSYSSYYKVKREIRAGNKGVVPGESWIRYGESNANIDIFSLSRDSDLALSHRESFHIFPRQIRGYFDKLLSLRNIRRSHELPAYQDLYTQSGDYVHNAYNSFILQNEYRVLVVIGHTGVGKTVSLERFIYELSVDGLSAAESYIKDERFELPDIFIPVPISLWHLRDISSSKDIERIVLSKINSLGGFANGSPYKLYRLLQNYKWVICFDGLDEILSFSAQNQFISALQNFSIEFPNIKIILLSRPYYTIIGFLDSEHNVEWTKIVIQPFTDEQIRNFLAVVSYNLPVEEQERISEVITGNDELKKICSYPAFLNYALRELYGIDLYNNVVHLNQETIPDTNDDTGRDPRIGVILDDIYRGIWKREEQKKRISHSKTSEWWKITGTISLRIKRYTMFQVDVLRNIFGGYEEHFLFWLLNLNILREADQRYPTYYQFFTKITQAYFGATLIDNLLTGTVLGDSDIINAETELSGCAADLRQIIVNILGDISPYAHLIKGGAT